MERPSGMGGFQFVILASLRAAQLMRGCLPRVDGGHKKTVTALLEVSQGKVVQDFRPAHPIIGAATLAPVAAALPVATADIT